MALRVNKQSILKTRIFFCLAAIFLVSCDDNRSSKFYDKNNIKRISTDNDITRDFDREKYSLIQEAILLQLDGKYLQAIEQFNEAEKVYGEHIHIYLNRGSSYGSINRIKDAESEYTKCIELDSTYLPPLLNRGLIYTHTNRLEQALLDFNQAIEIMPNEPASYLNRAVAYREKGQLNLACNDLSKAISLGIVAKYEDDTAEDMLEELDCN